MNRLRLSWGAILSLAMCLLVGVEGARADWIDVDNAGNAPDTRYGGSYGAVAYPYRISEFEVTNRQWIDFLSAVASQSDPHGLYNTNMAGTYGGIDRTGSGPYTYAAKGGDTAWLDRPVNYVSWYDALRYCNWLSSGQTESGVYTFTDETTVSLPDHSTLTGDVVFLPTEDEWYKAAYHDKSAGLAAGYFDYPTGTNTVPSNDLTDPDPGNNANFYDSGYTLGSPYYTTLVGEFENSESPYGTFDQGGNLWEWNELDVYGDGSIRGVRGGPWGDDSGYLRASVWGLNDPTVEDVYLGFRVASPYSLEPVPEPSSVLMLVTGLGGLLLWKWRRRGT
jgi:sulfatase modifying factor 1